MRNRLRFLARNLCFLFLPAGPVLKAQIMWQMSSDTVITWHYQEGDEFNEEKVNTGYWDYWYGWARTIITNKEQQYYTDGRNHELKNGVLDLTAKKESITAKLIDWRGENDSIVFDNKFYGLNKMPFNYSAGFIQSKKNFMYGYFEIKFTMTDLKGYWPAFWLYGGTPNEEIDMMELKTERKNQIHVGRHSQKKHENYSRVFLSKKVWGDWVKFKGDLTQNYNVISGEWTQDYVKFYLNGECIAATYLSLNEPKKLVANIAVPADNGPFKPGPAAEQQGTGEFKIDYIRVWTNASTGEQFPSRRGTFSEPESCQRGIASSSLVSKKKYIYGKKEWHKNEGITVSIIPMSNGHYQLTVLGKNIPENATVKIFSGKDEKLSQRLSYGVSDLDPAKISNDDLRIEISAFGKTAIYSPYSSYMRR